MIRSPRRALSSVIVAAAAFATLWCTAGCSTAAHRPDPPGIGRPGPTVRPGAGVVGRPVTHRLIECFEEGARRPDKPEKIASCETSAVAYAGGQIYVASDKQMPGAKRSPVFAIGLQSFGGRMALAEAPWGFLTQPAFRTARKYEDMAVDHERKLVWLTTGFDRIDPENPGWDAYNTLLAFPFDDPDGVYVVNPADDGTVPSSLPIRTALHRAVAEADDRFDDEVPYLKVEALEATTDGRLLFGVREYGAKFDDFDYSVMFIEARVVDGDDGKLQLDLESFRVIYDLEPLYVYGHRVAVSSLARDPYRDRYYVLTSYEHEGTDTALGGYLFVLDNDELAAGEPPRLLRRPDGDPLQFGHKPEGITVLDEFTLLVIHDDDRVTEQTDIGSKSLSFKRKPHQAAYAIVELAPKLQD